MTFLSFSKLLKEELLVCTSTDRKSMIHRTTICQVDRSGELLCEILRLYEINIQPVTILRITHHKLLEIHHLLKK